MSSGLWGIVGCLGLAGWSPALAGVWPQPQGQGQWIFKTETAGTSTGFDALGERGPLAQPLHATHSSLYSIASMGSRRGSR